MDKQHQDELGYYTDFEGLEVDFNDDPNELYDLYDDNMVERDHLDILDFCTQLEFYEYHDDAQFNYLED